LETWWHRAAIALLVEAVSARFAGREDFFVGGNMFIYFSLEQARTRQYRGPDFFFVKDINRWPIRRYWAVWLEGGRYPDVIVELASPTTAEVDRTTKKDLYAKVFHTREYFIYDPDSERLEGWRLDDEGHYQAILANEHGWLWSKELGMWLGTWRGKYLEAEATWLRFYDAERNLVLLSAEAFRQRAETAEVWADAAERQRTEAEQLAEAERQRAETERQRAEAEHQRAQAAEAEAARLRARLAELGQPLD
jgi:Uma2 family endonuclease